MSRFFKHNGVLMFEPDPIAGNSVVRKATAEEVRQHEKRKEPPAFLRMTKEEIEQWAIDNYGVNLNTRETKANMIATVEAML